MNPPGYMYAVSYVVCACLLYVCVKSSLLKVERKGIAAIFSGFIIAWMILSDGISEWLFWPCMIVTVLLLYGMLVFGFGFKPLSAAYYTAHAFILGEGCASIEWQIAFFLRSVENMHPAAKILIMVLLYVLICAALYYIERKVHRRGMELDQNRRQVISVGAIAFVIFCLSNLSYVPVSTPFSGGIPEQIFNIHTWIDLGGIAILIAYHVMVSEVQVRVEMENLQNIVQMQYQNYKISEQSVDIVNQKYHDLKHQIAVLRLEFGTKEGLEYLNQMQNEIEVYETLNKTGNRILDTILTSKSIYCQSQHIKLNCVADGAALDFMDVVDISALFGNALDNAIECVSKIDDPEKKLIHLAIVRQKGFLRIRVENCCIEELEFENGLPKTSKSNKKLHGFGVKSMKSIVKKYNGSLTLENKDGWFELRILIPLPRAERVCDELES